MTRECLRPETTLYGGKNCHLGPADYCQNNIVVQNLTKRIYGTFLAMGCQFATAALASMTKTILGQEDNQLDPLL